MAKTKSSKISAGGATAAAYEISSLPNGNSMNIFPVYSNNAAVMHGPSDFRIIFSEIVLLTAPGTPIIEARANVAMSPAQFKSLIAAMQTTLKQFEDINGEIKWQPEKLPSQKM